MRTTRLLLFVLLAVAALASCGDTGGAQDDDDIPADPDLVIASRDLEFDPTQATVPAGEEIAIVHDNQDEGTNHNLHLRDAPDSPKTPLEQGKTKQLLTVTLDPGTYVYTCDLHANMKGTLTAQ
jgi:plastocyanin